MVMQKWSFPLLSVQLRRSKPKGKKSSDLSLTTKGDLPFKFHARMYKYYNDNIPWITRGSVLCSWINYYKGIIVNIQNNLSAQIGFRFVKYMQICIVFLTELLRTENVSFVNNNNNLIGWTKTAMNKHLYIGLRVTCALFGVPYLEQKTLNYFRNN